MIDEHQLLKQGKPTGREIAEMEQGASCPPSTPAAAPLEQPRESAGKIGARLPDAKDCRECLSAMTHRLAQPMTALRGGIELGLMGKRSAGDYRSILEQSLQLADHMAQMIISLRDLGESGTSGGSPECLPLETTATEILAELECLAEARDLHLQLDAEGACQVSANPDRLRETLQNLLTWVIQNSAGPGVVNVKLSASAREVQVLLSPPRLDLQYLQIKVLAGIATPGMLFAHAVKSGVMGWAINQRLVDGMGGKLEILTEGPEAGCIRVLLPLPPSGAKAYPS